MADLTGTTIGKYQIIEQLGEGGMATVYKAFDPRLKRDVAIKIIRKDAIPENTYDRILKRFMREAKALASLSDLHIVKILDYGEHDGSPYLVMEYLSGGTLKSLTGTPMPVEKAARLLAPIARALASAHRKGIIHRDVKPANILLSEKNEPMLSDFGIAKITEMEDGNTLTGVNMGVGTPEYMAPEQWLNKITPQTDIYALGVVLFELVTGKKPYVADTPATVLLKQAMNPLPKPSGFVPGLPDAVEKVIFKAMAKQPEERFGSMDEFAATLEQLQNQLPMPSHPPAKHDPVLINPPNPDERQEKSAKPPGIFQRRRPRNLWLIGILAVCTLAGISFGSIWLTGGQSPSLLTPSPVITTISPKIIVKTLPSETPTPVPPTPTETSLPSPTMTQTPGIGSFQISAKDGMKQMYVPAGSFLMGSDLKKDPAANADELPQHTVSLKAFWIDKTEITNAMYALCVAAGTCKKPESADYSNPDKKDFPVITYKWDNAKDYCQWAGRRLLTEAEWEKAARGTDGRIYPMGDELLAIREGIFAVGTMPNDTSPFGALDLSGNVAEWVQDWYSSKYYKESPELNPKGPDTGTLHVMRGGSSFNKVNMTRTANRNPNHTYQSKGSTKCNYIYKPEKFCIPVYDLKYEKPYDVGIRCGMDGD